MWHGPYGLPPPLFFAASLSLCDFLEMHLLRLKHADYIVGIFSNSNESILLNKVSYGLTVHMHASSKAILLVLTVFFSFFPLPPALPHVFYGGDRTDCF